MMILSKGPPSVIGALWKRERIGQRLSFRLSSIIEISRQGLCSECIERVLACSSGAQGCPIPSAFSEPASQGDANMET